MAKKSTKKTLKPVRPQLGDGVEILNAGSVLEDPITRTLETNYTVSYTHLDVYKRQPHGRAAHRAVPPIGGKMQVTVKLSSREGAAHISGILAGFTLLAKRGELTLRVQDVRQGNPRLLYTSCCPVRVTVWMVRFQPVGRMTERS